VRASVAAVDDAELCSLRSSYTGTADWRIGCKSSGLAMQERGRGAVGTVPWVAEVRLGCEAPPSAGRSSSGSAASALNEIACAAVDRAIGNLNAGMRQRHEAAEGERMRAQWHDLTR